MKKILILLIICITGIMLISCGDNKHIGEAKTPAVSSAMKGKNYKDVIEEFEKRGFNNIKTEKIDDLIVGWLKKEGEVKEVSVGGDVDYSADKWIPADTEIIIKYHVFPESSEQPITPNENQETQNEIEINEDEITNTPIDKKGQIYEVNQTVDFDLSSLEIKRIKIVKDAYYIIMMEYTVTNKSDDELIWKFHYSGNFCGTFESPSYNALPDHQKTLGGDSAYIYDDDIGSNHHLDGHLQGKETISASVNFMLSTGIGYGGINLLEDEPMTLTLDYVENEKRYTYEIRINQ